MEYCKMSAGELLAEKEKLLGRYAEYKRMNLRLDLSRGKPGQKQLDLLTGMLNIISTPEDCRTRTELTAATWSVEGIPEVRGFSSQTSRN